MGRLFTSFAVSALFLLSSLSAMAFPRGGFGGGFGGFRAPAPSFNAERSLSNRFVDVHPVNPTSPIIRPNNFSPNIIPNRPINNNFNNNFNNDRVNINNAGNIVNWNRNNNVIVNPNRNVIVNPRWNNNPWWWNRGNPWYPVPYYWGGGFWGNLAIGITSAAVAGAVAGSVAGNNSPTVVVNSPGGQLLTAYGLVQVPCSGNVVVIYGPSGSVVCAQPNSLVSAGVYTIDTSTLSLIPQ
ncbi:hypothetical protein [Thermosynechococcus sp. FA-CM-4201]